jgi:hypothetical protein
MSNSFSETIFQGDTTNVYEFSSVANADISSPDFTGLVVVKEAKCNGKTEPGIDNSKPSIISRALPKDTGNTKFLAWLTPDETNLLAENKKYIWIVQTSNATLIPPMNKEVHILLEVLPQGA